MKQAILVLGMHRSGTSAITRVISLLGAKLPSGLMEPGADNESGFWESAEIANINDHILEKAGLSWDSVLPFRAGWLQSEAARELEEQSLDLLNRNFGVAEFFVLKDPRMSRLVPFWVNVLARFKAVPYFIIALRNPLEIIASLQKRNGFPPQRSALLWLRYMLEVEYATRGMQRIFVSYEQLLRDWRSSIDCVAKSFSIRWPLRESGEEKIDAFLCPKLRHHAHSDDELYVNPDVMSWVKDGYYLMAQAIGSQGDVGMEGALDKIQSEMDQADEIIESVVDSYSSLAHQIALKIEMKKQVDALHDELVVVKSECESLRGSMQDARVQADKFAASLAERDKRLHDLLQSTSWRITKPLRVLKIVTELLLWRRQELRPYASGLAHKVWMNLRILVLDHCTPTPDQDAGSITTLNIMRILVRNITRRFFVVGRGLYRLLPIRDERIRLRIRAYAFRYFGRLMNGALATSAKRAGGQSNPVIPMSPLGDPTEYLLAPADDPILHDDGYPVSRFMHHIWQSRLDLQKVFDLHERQSRLEFCKWFLSHAAIEYNLTADVYSDALLHKLVACGGEVAVKARVVIAEKASLAADRPTDCDNNASQEICNHSDADGANLIGYARGEFGMGEHVRMVAYAFASVGTPFSIIDYPENGVHGLADDSVKHWVNDHQPYAFNIFHINADIFPSLYFKFGRRFFWNRYNIGYWAWELSKCPPEFDLALNMVDEVWAISEFVAESFRTRSPVPVVHMPLAVRVPNLNGGYTKRHFGVPEDSFMFLFTFDAASYLDRKNPIAIVRAFKLAFPRGDERAVLVLKTMNCRRSDPLWKALITEAETDQRITIMTKRLQREEVLGLYAVCDAFVSLHRSEGFGRCLAEAMLFGKPVIATNYSGTREFAREGKACLVDYTLVPVPEDSYPFWHGQVWAEPNIESAAAYMQRLITDGRYRTMVAQAGKEFVLEEFNEAVIGARYAKRLEILRRLKSRRFASISPADDEVNGFIDLPLHSAEPLYGSHIPIAGWAVARRGIKSIEIYCDAMLAGQAHYGVIRQDVGKAFPHIPDSARSGFFWMLDTTTLARSSHTVRVVAHSRSGKSEEWTRTFVLGDANYLYGRWLANNATLTFEQRNSKPSGGLLKSKPLFSIILQADTSIDEEVLRTLVSLVQQSYQLFELVVVGRERENRAVKKLAQHIGLADRLNLVTGEANWQGAIQACKGEFISLVDVGDVFDSRALRAAAESVVAEPAMDLIYADEDRLIDHRRAAPTFKPAWSPIYLENYNYIGRPWFARKSLITTSANVDVPWNSEVAEYTLLRHLGCSARAIAHIPMVLLSRITQQGKCGPTSSSPPSIQKWQNANSDWPKVSVIVPTRLGDAEIVDRCLAGLLKGTDYPDLEVIVIANNLKDADPSESYLRDWPFKVLSWNDPFNWSKINNFGVRHASGDYFLFMNDDVEPINRDWLKAMVELGRLESVGAVGAVLRYPNGTIQHGGITLVAKGNGTIHTFRFCSGKEPEVVPHIQHNREQIAVTGACILSRRDCFNVVGGFDEQLPLVCNDTDFCLRLWDHGYSCVIAAAAELTHHEGISRAGISEVNDVKLFWKRWGKHIRAGDPFCNPNLDFDQMDWGPAPDSRGSLAGRVRFNITGALRNERRHNLL